MVSSFVLLLLVFHGASGVIHCGSVVTVDQSTNNTICDESTLELNGTCSDLQDALLLVAQSKPSSGVSLNQTASQSCLEVCVLSGSYVISEFIEFEQQNVAIRGVNSVEVSFNFSDKFDPTETIDPMYLISFVNTDYAEITGINFSDSPGIITFENVTSVIVQNSSFR